MRERGGKGVSSFFLFFEKTCPNVPPNADEDCILEKQKNDACERSRLFRARIASREIVFRVNPCETCEKHFEECVSIGLPRFERYNVVECGLRFLFFLNRSILMQSSPTHAAIIIPIFSKNKIRASRSSQCHDAKRKENEKKNALCQ